LLDVERTFLRKSRPKDRFAFGQYFTTFLGDSFFGIDDALHTRNVFPGGCHYVSVVLVGIVGNRRILLGDLCLFKSYTIIGSRTAQLVMSLAPMLTALIGWLFLHETLSVKSIMGIVVSVSGIMIAVAGRHFKLYIPLKGFLFAFGRSIGASRRFGAQQKRYWRL